MISSAKVDNFTSDILVEYYSKAVLFMLMGWASAAGLRTGLLGIYGVKI